MYVVRVTNSSWCLESSTRWRTGKFAKLPRGQSATFRDERRESRRQPSRFGRRRGSSTNSSHPRLHIRVRGTHQRRLKFRHRVRASSTASCQGLCEGGLLFNCGAPLVRTSILHSCSTGKRSGMRCGDARNAGMANSRRTLRGARVDGLRSVGVPAILDAARKSWLHSMWQHDKRCFDPDDHWCTRWDVEPVASVHVRWARDALSNFGGQGGRLHAAPGAAIDTKVGRKRVRSQSSDATCTCGELEPDRAHWMCACPQRYEKPGDPLDQHLSMTKLGVARRIRKRCFEKRALLRQQVTQIATWFTEAEDTVTTATDGGTIGKNTEERCGAWGVAVPSAHYEHCSAGGKVAGRDQTAFACELFAAHVRQPQRLGHLCASSLTTWLYSVASPTLCGAHQAPGARTSVDGGLRTFGRSFRAKLLLGTISWRERKVACS